MLILSKTNQLVTYNIVSLRYLHILVVIFVLQISVRLDGHSRMLPLFLIRLLNNLILPHLLLLILSARLVIVIPIESVNWTRVHAPVDEQ